jgi:hypothetical protein
VVRTGNDGYGLYEIERDGDVWRLTLAGFTEAGAAGTYLWPGGAPAGVRIVPTVVVQEPAQVGQFELTGLTAPALAAMEPWCAHWFGQLGGIAEAAGTTGAGPGQPGLTVAPRPTHVEVLRIWFNAFIPTAMVDGPPGYDHFSGDDRGFSADPGASARMHSEITIVDLYSAQPSFTQYHSCGTTHEVTADGTVIDSATAGTDMMQFYDFRYPGGTVWDWDQSHPPAAHPPEITLPDTAPVTVSYTGKGGNPLVAVAPWIDLWAKISYDRQNHVLSVEGAVDAFPAFEGYASWYGGPGGGHEVLFTLEAGPGGPISLTGSASRPFSTTLGLKGG